MHLVPVGKTMKTRPGSIVATLLVLAVGACGDSVTGVDTATDDLLGTWNITSLAFTPAGGGTATEGLTGTATIAFRADLTYTLTFTEGLVQEIDDGTFSVSGSTLTLTLPGEDPDELTVTALSSTAATLYADDETFDFNDDGTETDATLTVTLQK